MNINGDIIDFSSLTPEQTRIALWVYGGLILVVFLLLILLAVIVARSLSDARQNTREITKLFLTVPEPYFDLTGTMYQDRKKNTGIAVLLALSFGVIGAHHVYLENKRAAVLSILFFWTGIPGICSIFQALSMSRTVSEKNLLSLLEIMEITIPVVDNRTDDEDAI